MVAVLDGGTERVSLTCLETYSLSVKGKYTDIMPRNQRRKDQAQVLLRSLPYHLIHHWPQLQELPSPTHEHQRC